MTPKGRGSGGRPPNRGDQGVRVDDESSPNTNIPPSSVLPTLHGIFFDHHVE